MSNKLVTARSGDTFEVDTSDAACSEFGFKHGDRVLIADPEGAVDDVKATIIGVAGRECGKGKKVLWFLLDTEDRVSYTELGYILLL